MPDSHGELGLKPIFQSIFSVVQVIALKIQSKIKPYLGKECIKIYNQLCSDYVGGKFIL